MSVDADKSATSSQVASPSPAVPDKVATSSGDTNASPDASSSAGPAAGNPTGFVLPPGMAPIAGMQFLPYFPPMAAVAAPSGEAGDGNAQAQAAPGAMMFHPAFLQQMYSYPYGMMPPGMKLKRKQVKNACTNCQKACKKCDDERPCTRCVKYGIADDCQDSVRKERRKGIKRGSYKKKPLPGEEEENTSANNAATAAAAAAQFLPAAAYSAQLYSQWAAAALGAAAGAKAGEGTAGYYPYFIAAPMPQGDGSTSGDGVNASAAAPALIPPMYYPGFAVPPSGEPPAASRAESAAKDKGDDEESEEAMDAEEDAEEDEEDEEDYEHDSSKRKRAKKKKKGN